MKVSEMIDRLTRRQRAEEEYAKGLDNRFFTGKCNNTERIK